MNRSGKRNLNSREVISRCEPKMSVGINLGEIEIFALVHPTGIIYLILGFYGIKLCVNVFKRHFNHPMSFYALCCSASKLIFSKWPLTHFSISNRHYTLKYCATDIKLISNERTLSPLSENIHTLEVKNIELTNLV